VQALKQFLPSIGMGGINDYYRAPSSIGEGQTDGGYLDPAMMKKLDDMGYTFGRTGGINQDNYWDVMKDGQVVNRYQTGSHSGLDAFMSNGGALLPALAGAALFGMGGVGAGTGLLGGGGATAGGGAMSMGDAIAASAASEGAGLGGVGAAGAGGGAMSMTDAIAASAASEGATAGGIGSLKGLGSSVLGWAAKNPMQALQIAGLAKGLIGGKNSGGSGGSGIAGLVDQSALTKTAAAPVQRQVIAPPAGYRPGIDPEHRYFSKG
jgi:hypothetical protein